MSNKDDELREKLKQLEMLLACVGSEHVWEFWEYCGRCYCWCKGCGHLRGDE